MHYRDNDSAHHYDPGYTKDKDQGKDHKNVSHQTHHVADIDEGKPSASHSQRADSAIEDKRFFVKSPSQSHSWGYSSNNSEHHYHVEGGEVSKP
jgi:hypothetical protein